MRGHAGDARRRPPIHKEGTAAALCAAAGRAPPPGRAAAAAGRAAAHISRDAPRGFVGSFAVAILRGIEPLLSAVIADGLTGTKDDLVAELLALGIGNIVTSFFGGIPATGAIAGAATNVRSGARSPSRRSPTRSPFSLPSSCSRRSSAICGMAGLARQNGSAEPSVNGSALADGRLIMSPSGTTTKVCRTDLPPSPLR
jgi:hypothetical protein